MHAILPYGSPALEMIARRMIRAANTDRKRLQITSRFGGKAGHIYDEVERRLMTGVYPFGAEISNLELVREYGASRAPVTMALNLLQAAGYVVIKPQIGVWVTSPSDEEIVSFFHLSAKAESRHAGAAAERSTPETLAILETILARLIDAPADSEADRVIERITLEGLFQAQIRLMAGTPWLSHHSASAWRMSNFLIANRAAPQTEQTRSAEDRVRAQIIWLLRDRDATGAAELMDRFAIDRCVLAER